MSWSLEMEQAQVLEGREGVLTGIDLSIMVAWAMTMRIYNKQPTTFENVQYSRMKFTPKKKKVN